ncbi:MAG: DNA-binding response regulator [Candidatus Rokubacteria bacterium]|nr:DNA-binding response regulator [Candidatus Rokubacteria bacterium]
MLVVEDDEGVRAAYRVIFESEYDIVAVPDGLSAIEIVQSRPVDVVLLEILMRGIDGLEVLREIKAFDGQIPVVMATAVKTVRTAVDAMRLGAFDYLTKPFDDEEVLGVARRAVAQRRQQAPPGAGGTARPLARAVPAPGRILIIGGDIGWQSVLAVALQRSGLVELVATAAALVADADLRWVKGVIVDPGEVAPGILGFLTALRERLPISPVLVLGAAPDVSELRTPRLHWVARAPGHLARLVDGMTAACPAGRPAAAPLTPYSGRAMEHLAIHYGHPLTVAGVAGAIGISESHLAHTFRADTGMSVRKFLTRVRVRVAEHLLATTSGKVAGIAAKAGFFDASHLARVLRRHAGPRSGARRPTRAEGL